MKRYKLTPLPARAPFKRTLTLLLLTPLAIASLAHAVSVEIAPLKSKVPSTPSRLVPAIAAGVR